MLTPRKDDVNRKAELVRRKKEPETFGATHSSQRKPDDWAPSGLVAANGRNLSTDPRVEK